MPHSEPIAIIGTGCKFPGQASSPSRLWELLKRPLDLSRRIPSDRFNIEGFYHPHSQHHGTANVEKSYFLDEDIRSFSPSFFNISAAEAESMDPQQRLLLETTYEAIERAGLRPRILQGSSTGVFAGVMCDDFSQILARDVDALPKYTSTGIARNNISNRISYFFDWNGPSITLDTACSSSLYALHLAVQSLRDGGCDQAVACGTNLILSPIFYISASNLNMLSPTGKCRMWDTSADGYARGEGVASVVVKRLSDAIRDGDPIECIVRETGANQDGRSMGITMPSSQAQTSLIRSTYMKAGLDPDSMEGRPQYFEAHGTGTQAGDPQEAEAISKAFFAKSGNSMERKLIVGSIKTVIGHTEGCAGLAGLLKASLCLQNGEISPNQHFKSLNKRVAPFYHNLHIPTELTSWPRLGNGQPKRCSINSFGFGGSNAHAILESYEQAYHGHLILTSMRHLIEENKLSKSNGVFSNGTQTNGTHTDYSLTNGSQTDGSYPKKPHSRGSLNNQTNTIGPFTNNSHVNGSHTTRSPTTGSDVNGSLAIRSNPSESFVMGSRVDQTCTIGSDLEKAKGHSSNFLPFAFSAVSKKSLYDLLERTRLFLESDNLIDTDLAALSKSLLCHRDDFSYKVVLYSSCMDELLAELSKVLTEAKAILSWNVAATTKPSAPKILGVFTGQGAQWPRMGLDVIESFPHARKWVSEMQESLDELPKKYGPRFSLLDELSAPMDSSRVGSALVSQSLCTLVQVIQVNLLRLLNIEFSAVIGHSSGEIAAAYAAEFVSARDAIRIAYLRGFYAKLAGANAQRGAMIAAGLSHQEAQELCSQEPFQGRVVIAAVNSPNSVTLSGDRDIVTQVQHELEQRNKFARLLKVDIAYHSHHMEPCSKAYIKALEEINIQIHTNSSTIWYSSVHRGERMGSLNTEELKATYWSENMLNSVLFSSAATAAAKDQEYNLFIELGPHPALKGPMLQTVTEISPNATEIPYIGMLNRGGDGTLELAKAMGQIWTLLGPDMFHPSSYYKALRPHTHVPFLAGLPTYAFDKSKQFWTESRALKALTQCQTPSHALLGKLAPDLAQGEWRWRNYLQPSILEWINGHQIESTIVFPATGYIAMALEAASVAGQDAPVQMIEISDFSILQSISFENESKDVETFFKIENVRTYDEGWEADFSCHASFSNDIRRCAEGRLHVILGESSTESLPQRTSLATSLRHVESARFYDYLKKLGYGYEGAFQGIVKLSRKQDIAAGALKNHTEKLFSPSSLMFHPVTMDTLLQTILAAVGTPDDGRLHTLFIPTRIDRISINPKFGHANLGSDTLDFDALITDYRAGAIVGNASLYDSSGSCIINMESVRVATLNAPIPADDRLMFSETHWGLVNPDASLPYVPPSAKLEESARQMEKLTLLQIRDINQSIQPEDRKSLTWHGKRIVSWFDHVLDETRQGRHPICQEQWLSESVESIASQLNPDQIDFEAVELVSSTMLPFLRGETTILEQFKKRDLLTRLYQEFTDTTIVSQMGAVASQIAFRFPHLKILEVGAGTGSATKAILDRIGHSFYSYTFTDISPSFFEQAQSNFNEFEDQFIYRTFDIEKDPGSQGFENGQYDMVVAANVLHATKSIKSTLERIRRLLKPGGYLVGLEGLNTDVLVGSFVFSGFEGWWLGEDEGRVWGPMAQEHTWDNFLKSSGFSGVDTVTPDHGKGLRPFSVFVSQAVDEAVGQLREPLLQAKGSPKYGDLIIVGGSGPPGSTLASDVAGLVSSYFSEVLMFENLESVIKPDGVTMNVLNLEELDRSCFKDISELSFTKLQDLLGSAQALLWVTGGAESENLHRSMSKGFLASLGYENGHARMQNLNIVAPEDVRADTIAEHLLRVVLDQDGNDHALPSRTWATEMELSLDHGVLRTSRMIPDRAMNEKYMSNRRVVKHHVSLRNTNVEVEVVDNTYELVESQVRDLRPNFYQLRIIFSTAHSILIPGVGLLYVAIGEDIATQKLFAALSDQQASVISAPASSCVALPPQIAAQDSVRYLEQILTFLVALNVTSTLPSGSGILVHEPSASLRKAVSHYAASNNLTCHFSTCGTPCNSLKDTITFQRTASAKEIKDRIPSDTFIAVMWDKSSFSRRLQSLLPSHVKQMEIDGLFSVESLSEVTASQIVSKAILEACERATMTMESDDSIFKSVSVSSLSRSRCEDTKLQIVDWTSEAELEINVRLASHRTSLSPDKTFLLVGMTGDLGRSVCKWMISKGARHIVLTSRKPNVEEDWLNKMSSLGAKVITMSMDVTSKESILRVDAEINATLPPVGGVVNGAMILADSLFSSMTLGSWLQTTQPKVEGTLLLNELYSSPSLELFILMGSVSGPLGNRSQSSYSAANTFMSSVIAARRRAGLVGSIINPAQILGVGYVSSSDARLLDSLSTSIGCYALSEFDLHELFAEAIEAGRPNSGRVPEIHAGFRRESPREKPDLIWYRNPKTWHFVEHSLESSAADAQSGRSADVESVKTQLTGVTDETEIESIITSGFLKRVGRKLQLESEEDGLTPGTTPANLGVDSLVAVDLRTWFMKELGVDVPVLRILGGATIGELAQEAARKYAEKK